jgi:hypothetical protein
MSKRQLSTLGSLVLTTLGWSFMIISWMLFFVWTNSPSSSSPSGVLAVGLAFFVGAIVGFAAIELLRKSRLSPRMTHIILWFVATAIILMDIDLAPSSWNTDIAAAFGLTGSLLVFVGWLGG